MKPELNHTVTRNLINEVDVHVGAALHRLRTQASLSVDELAGFLEVDAGRLALIETGAQRASAEVIYAAAKHFGVSPAVFFEV
jgi:transcriptional regulator with XRE-family HTH domain